MNNLDINLFNWNDLWVVAGPFIIMGITALIIGIIFMIIISGMPKGIIKELVKVVAIVAIIGGALLSLYVASNIWSM